MIKKVVKIASTASLLCCCCAVAARVPAVLVLV